MGIILYNFFIVLYGISIKTASLWNNKAKLWVLGRRQFPSFSDSSKKIWMHCASLGEFEQGRPVLEKIKKQYPHYQIVVSFFSPSGYEIRKNYNGADFVIYLPTDSKKNAQKLITAINPALVIWVKYEFWFHYLSFLKNNNIPVILISAIFRKNQPFFRWYGKFWIKMMDCFSQIFVQDKESVQLLNKIGIKNVTVSGDTRFDRVFDIASNNEQISVIEKFIGNNKSIMAGSTWTEDEVNLAAYSKKNKSIKLIIAPHEINHSNLERLLKLFDNAILFSKWSNQLDQNNFFQVLIIDNIGMLSKIYKYATIAYIGGGFNKAGIHNTLEAAVYGKPIVFGPNYLKFKEAKDLIEQTAAFSVSNGAELENKLDMLLNDNSILEKSGKISGNYVMSKRGATEIILEYIKKNVS